MVRVRKRLWVHAVAWSALGIASFNTGHAQMMQRRVQVPAPAESPPATGAAEIKVPFNCDRKYRGPPVISFLEWPGKSSAADTTIAPYKSYSGYMYIYAIFGCGLISLDQNAPEIVGVDFGRGVTLSDGRLNLQESYRNHDFILEIPGPMAQDVMRKFKTPMGPFRIVVETPLGRAQTESIYYFAPIPADNSPGSVIAPAVSMACIADQTPRILTIDGLKTPIGFSNFGQWTIAGCGFGASKGEVELAGPAGERIATHVINWSEREIVIGTQDFSGTTTSLDGVALRVVPSADAALSTASIHNYRLVSVPSINGNPK